MLLWEFEDDIIGSMRSEILDALTPLAVNGVPSISIQSVAKKLAKMRSGIVIDRDLILKILDPDEVKMIVKIDGDNVYFKLPQKNSKTSQDQAEKDKETVSRTAAKQAKKNLSRT